MSTPWDEHYEEHDEHEADVLDSEDDVASWQKTEERFARLVRLGGDPRTPDNERNVACRAAVKMFTDGKMTVTSTGRWEAILKLVRRLIRRGGGDVVSTERPGRRCYAPFNLNGTNGWRCCQCGSLNKCGVMFWLGDKWRTIRCTTCLHARCDLDEESQAAYAQEYKRRYGTGW